MKRKNVHNQGKKGKHKGNTLEIMRVKFIESNNENLQRVAIGQI